MRYIQARRRRTIVDQTAGDRARAVGNDTAHLSAEPEQVDVDGWENEGGAAHPNGDGGASLFELHRVGRHVDAVRARGERPPKPAPPASSPSSVQ